MCTVSCPVIPVLGKYNVPSLFPRSHIQAYTLRIQLVLHSLIVEGNLAFWPTRRAVKRHSAGTGVIESNAGSEQKQIEILILEHMSASLHPILVVLFGKRRPSWPEQPADDEWGRKPWVFLNVVCHLRHVPRLSFRSMSVNSNCSLASFRAWASLPSIPIPFRL